MRRTVFAFLLAFPFLCSAQAEDSLLARITHQLEMYASWHSSPGLYLHLDKSIYTHNEHIWFTGYLLDPQPDPAAYHTLHVVLMDELTKKIVRQDRFIMDKGFGKGQLLLNDSLPAGEYRLIAYTNTFLEHPEQPLFQQGISLRAAFRSPLDMTVKEAASNAAGDSIYFLPRITSSTAGLAAGGGFQYIVYANGQAVAKGTKKIDPFGEVRVVLPAKEVMDKSLELSAEVNHNGEIKAFRMPLLPAKGEVRMKFYPEGGNLVAGHACRIAFEMQDGSGRALALKGSLLENDKPLAAFESDRQGTGVIECTPVAGASYRVQIDGPDTYTVHADFPPVEVSGYTIEVRHAVVKDTLSVYIQAPGAGSQCLVLVHNDAESFYAAHAAFRNGKGWIKIPVKEMPAGMATITLFDERGVPRAERAVLLNSHRPVQVSMKTDSAFYHQRSRLTLSIRMKDADNKPVQGLFSLAAVLEKRLDTGRFADITRFFLFDQHLPQAGLLPSTSWLQNESHVERLLLIRFWTRYRWNEMATAVVQKLPAVCDAGHVEYRDKRVIRPVSMLLIGPGNVQQFETDSAGNFELGSAFLQGPPDAKLLLSVAEKKNADEYKIILEDRCAEVKRNIAARPYNGALVAPDELSAEEKRTTKSTMQTVVIKTKLHDDNMDVFRSTTCNDYVCLYNILNCRNHRSGSVPLEGVTYYYSDGIHPMRSVIYRGCHATGEVNDFVRQVAATHFAKEFYVADYARFNPPETELYTTVFWSHLLQTDANGEATLSFYTNDLAGKFICVLEGLSSEGPVSGKCQYRVEEK